MSNWLAGRPFWQVSLLSLILGILSAATFAPVHLIFLLPICYSGLLVLLMQVKTGKQAFFVGWWFGFGQFVLGLYWIGVAFTIDANAHAALIPVPTLVLPACLGLFTGFATYIIYKSGTRGISRILLFAAVWTVFEYVRGLLFTGFPWNLAGYSWGGMLAMLQWTAFIGIYGLTLLTIFISSIPALLADGTLSLQQRRNYVLLDCVLLVFLVGTGFWRLQAPAQNMIADTEIRVVQPNNPQKNKWKGDTRFEHLRNLMDISQTEGGQDRHWIWPETALPFFLTTDQRLQNYIAPRLPEGKTVISGAPRRHPTERKYWNSVQALSSDGTIQGVYDKRHLVPYGEYLPIREFFKKSGIASLIPALDNMSDFSFPEADMGKSTNYGDLPPARTLICYEVAFPWEVQAPDQFDWILNVTNDAWFGNTSGPHQHFVISRARAIEQGVSLIRSANNGISAIIDGYGRILQKRTPTEPGFLDGMIPAPVKSRTFYARYGESIPIALTLLFFILASLLTKWHMPLQLNRNKQ